MAESFPRILLHRAMLSDRVRVGLYKRAIHKIVRRGDVVVDLGSGSGILSYYSAAAGAKKVYAIEQGSIGGESLTILKSNNMLNRIDLLQGFSDKINIPERADVIVTETMGSFGLDENIQKFLSDAVLRFLKPGGRVIPSWLKVFTAPIESRYLWSKYVSSWSKPIWGYDLSAIQGYAACKKYVEDCRKRVLLLSDPSVLAELIFDRGPINRSSEYHTCFSISRNGDLHGFMGYFTAVLAPGVILSTSPTALPTCWQQVFFPVKHRLKVKQGDRLCLSMRSIPVATNSWWVWKTKWVRAGKVLESFQQSDIELANLAIKKRPRHRGHPRHQTSDTGS